MAQISPIQQIYLPKGKFTCREAKYGLSEKILRMSGFEKSEKILKALADRSRLQILECIQEGISNLGEIAEKLKRHRSTVEKHLRVLLAVNIVEKTPSLTKSGQLTIRYKMRDNTSQLLAAIQDAIQKF